MSTYLHSTMIYIYVTKRIQVSVKKIIIIDILIDKVLKYFKILKSYYKKNYNKKSHKLKHVFLS